MVRAIHCYLLFCIALKLAAAQGGSGGPGSMFTEEAEEEEEEQPKINFHTAKSPVSKTITTHAENVHNKTNKLITKNSTRVSKTHHCHYQSKQYNTECDFFSRLRTSLSLSTNMENNKCTVNVKSTYEACKGDASFSRDNCRNEEVRITAGDYCLNNRTVYVSIRWKMATDKVLSINNQQQTYSICRPVICKMWSSCDNVCGPTTVMQRGDEVDCIDKIDSKTNQKSKECTMEEAITTYKEVDGVCQPITEYKMVEWCYDSPLCEACLSEKPRTEEITECSRQGYQVVRVWEKVWNPLLMQCTDHLRATENKPCRIPAPKVCNITKVMSTESSKCFCQDEKKAMRIVTTHLQDYDVCLEKVVRVFEERSLIGCDHDMDCDRLKCTESNTREVLNRGQCLKRDDGFNMRFVVVRYQIFDNATKECLFKGITDECESCCTESGSDELKCVKPVKEECPEAASYVSACRKGKQEKSLISYAKIMEFHPTTHVMCQPVRYAEEVDCCKDEDCKKCVHQPEKVHVRGECKDLKDKIEYVTKKQPRFHIEKKKCEFVQLKKTKPCVQDCQKKNLILVLQSSYDKNSGKQYYEFVNSLVSSFHYSRIGVVASSKSFSLILQLGTGKSDNQQYVASDTFPSRENNGLKSAIGVAINMAEESHLESKIVVIATDSLIDIETEIRQQRDLAPKNAKDFWIIALTSKPTKERMSFYAEKSKQLDAREFFLMSKKDRTAKVEEIRSAMCNTEKK